MENRAHALAAGLFTLLLGAALAAVALWFSKDDIKLNPYVMTTSGAVTGLKVEAPVRYRGVDVGKVEDISIDAANSGRVQIRIGIREGTPITSSTYAQLGYQGITGLAYVLLGDDGKSRYPLETSPEAIAQIHMKPSLMDDGEVLFASFAEIAERIKRLLDEENQGHLRRTLAGMEEATQRASVAAKKLEPSLDAMPGLIAEAKGLAGDARGSLRKTDQLIDSVNGLALKLDQRVDTLVRAVAGVQTSVEEVGFTARAVNDETVPRVNALLDDLSTQTHAMGRVVNTLGEQPQSIVFGTPPGRPGPGEPGFTGGR
ncbi:MAG: MCE family protein [Burkholderiales bacterium]|nr:MCE family protein [Burkholderiales bacterium]